MKRLLQRVLTLFLVLTLVPLLFLLLTPIYIFRQFVILLAKCHPSLGQPMAIRSAYFAPELVEDGGQGKFIFNIVITQVYEGRMTVDIAKSWFAPLLLLKTAQGLPKYPELAQYLTTWLGFYFWKPDPTFSLDNHVGLLRSMDQPVNEEELKNIERELVRRKWATKRSPWEFKIISNFTPSYAIAGKSYSVGLFKVHHSMADGYSISNLFLKDIVGVNDLSSVGLPSIPRSSWVSTLFQNILVYLTLPFDIVAMIMTPPECPNLFHPPPKERAGNAKYFTATSPILPLQGLKEIKNLHKVSLKSVFYSAWAGAMRETFIQRGVTPTPPELHVSFPLPMPNHPDKLRNCWSAVVVPFPTGIADPIQRLKEIEGALQGLKDSTAPLTYYAMQPLLWALPHFMVKALAPRIPLPTGVASDFPGPSVPITKDGLTVRDVYFSLGSPPGCVGLTWLGTSYNGGWRVRVQVDGAVFHSDDEAQGLVNEVVRQIGILRDAIIV